MDVRKPKDYQLAEKAYAAYFNDQPQLWFADLSHEYQMRWVRVIRAVMGIKAPRAIRSSALSIMAARTMPPKDFMLTVPRKGTRIDWQAMTPRQRQVVKAVKHQAEKEA